MVPARCVPTALAVISTIGTGPDNLGMYSNQYLVRQNPTNIAGKLTSNIL